MKQVTKYVFETREEFDQWESEDGNTIYGIMDFTGKHIGDITEKNLENFHAIGKILSVDNPKDFAREALVKMVLQPMGGECNWLVLPNHREGLDAFLFEVEIKEEVITEVMIEEACEESYKGNLIIFHYDVFNSLATPNRNMGVVIAESKKAAQQIIKTQGKGKGNVDVALENLHDAGTLGEIHCPVLFDFDID